MHRAQFEALVRSLWLAYAAREVDLSKRTATLGLESEPAEHADGERDDATHPGDGTSGGVRRARPIRDLSALSQV